VVRANAREKASSRSSHPDVITHTDKTNAGNKRSFSVAKIDEAISTRRKKQRDQGRYEAMKYFMKGWETKALTWLELIFDDAKGGGGEGKECDGSATSLFCGTGHFS
jgi:hypothetical protein